MSSAPPLHDLVIRTVAEYLATMSYANSTLVKLQSLSKRFYEIRDIFIGQLILSEHASFFAYTHKPYGWNKVRIMKLYNDSNWSSCDIPSLGTGSIHTLYIGFWNDLDNAAPLRFIRKLFIMSAESLVDVSALGSVHTLYLFNCQGIRDVSALGGV